MKIVPKFALTNGNVCKVIELGDDYLVEIDKIFSAKNVQLYNNKEEAMFQKLVQELKRGRNLKNYKRSKYFSYYKERLKEEYPEYLI